MIRVTRTISIDEGEIREAFVRASGPGGQNVNKVATAVELRFDAGASPGLSGEVRRRLARLAGRRMTAGGVLVIQARRYRTQEANRRDALERLIGLLRRAACPPAPRRETHPTRASRQRRLQTKRRRALAKGRRRAVGDEDG